MSAEYQYEQLVSNFGSKRHELLQLITEIVPHPSELHRRRWRVQQLENSITDLKETITACNNQIDTERAKLDELNSEADRLRSQELKLIADLKILQGVTGMEATMPRDGTSEDLVEISAMSEEFRSRFADFCFDLPPIKQELPLDHSVERDSQILVDTMEDFVRLQFDTRSTDANLSKKATETTEEARKLEREVKEKELKLEREIECQRKRIQASAQRMKETIESQGDELRKQGAKLQEEYTKMMDELKRSTDDLTAQEASLKHRCANLELYNNSNRENLRRRAHEIEEELARLEKRMETIRSNPNTVDKKLVNMSLILRKKSANMDIAIAEMHRELAEFMKWTRK